MELDTIIKNLKTASGASRFLDSQIAQAIGWKKVRVQKAGGVVGNRWFPPGSQTTATCPFFTSNLEDAYQLTLSVDPHHAGAFVKEGINFRAQLEGDDVCYGSTPQIALCVAALVSKQRMQRKD